MRDGNQATSRKTPKKFQDPQLWTPYGNPTIYHGIISYSELILLWSVTASIMTLPPLVFCIPVERVSWNLFFFLFSIHYPPPPLLGTTISSFPFKSVLEFLSYQPARKDESFPSMHELFSIIIFEVSSCIHTVRRARSHTSWIVIFPFCTLKFEHYRSEGF